MRKKARFMLSSSRRGLGWLKRAWEWFGHGTRAAALYQLLLGWPQLIAAVVAFLATTAFGAVLPWAFLGAVDPTRP
jgi:hypothetical protein